MKILCMLPAGQGVYPPEAEERRFNAMRSYASPSTQIDVGYMPGISGFSPWGQSHDEIANTLKTASDRAAELSATLAGQAEERGYDAFCPFGTLDIGVHAARAAGVKIPVVGQAEASILYCGLLGRRFASCSYTSSPSEEELIHWRTEILGLDGLYTGPTAIGIPNSEYPARHTEVLGRFVQCADEARERGAEIMGLVAVSICPVEFSAVELSEAAGGFPVMDALAAQIAMAEWWHRMGLSPSLLLTPRKERH
jgi:Asp/Glu/hydantoin racemase